MTPEELKRAREIAEKCLVKRDNEAKRSLQEWAEHPPIFIMDIEAITLAEAVLHLSERNDELWLMVDSHFPEGLEGYQIIKKKGTSNAAEELVKDYIRLGEAVREAEDVISGISAPASRAGILHSCELWLSKWGEKK